jgi:hypothetical protein
MNTRVIDRQDVITMIDAGMMIDRGTMTEDAGATTTDPDTTTTADAAATTIDDTTTVDAVVTTIAVRRDGITIAETTDRTRRAREVCATRGGKASAIAATRADLRTLKTAPATLDAMIDAAIDRLKCATTGNAASARVATLAASCTRVNNALNRLLNRDAFVSSSNF